MIDVEKRDMGKIIAECDSFKITVDELKSIKLEDEERNKAFRWDAEIEEIQAAWKSDPAETLKRNNEVVKANKEVEQ